MKTANFNTKKIFRHKKIASGRTVLRKYKLWLLAIIVVPVVVILSLAFVLTASSHRHQKEISATELFTMANHIVSDTLDSLETHAYSILTDTDVNLFVFSNDISKDVLQMEHTLRLLTDTLKLNDCLISAQIYSFYNDYLFGTDAANYIENFPENKKMWLKHYEKTGATDFILPLNDSTPKQLCMVRSLRKNGQVCAFAIFYIDADALFSFKKNENYALISNIDNTILHSTEKAFDSDIADIKSKGKLINGRYMKSSFFRIMVEAPTSYSNMRLIMTSDDKDKTYIYTFIVCSIITVIASILLAILLAGHITNIFYSHIAKTISYLTSESGSIYDNTQDEIQWIENNIRTLLNSNKELELELSKSIIKLKNSQLAAMQMQCNPHFLFNALNLANMQTLSLLGGDNEASRIISLVSDLLYTSLNTGQYFIRIEEEINFAKKYIMIEEIKYNHNFDIEFDVDNSVINCKTVRLTLQPLIENAFRHGIHRLPSDIRGKLSVSVKPQGDIIVFKVSDNGISDTDKISKINNELDKDIYTIVEQNIGLKNVNSRIKILFGARYGCRIYRNDNKTISEIIIPNQSDNNNT